MKRSQIEIYLDIIGILSNTGPLNLTHIMYKANLNCNKLKTYLSFLTKQGLVEKKTIGCGKTIYDITPLGLTILKQFKELKEVLPIVS
jgi:predicted transcriptional regulator